ncbi:hypothetical protein [Exiguobacterium sp. s157]|uniref:hypothetical protein n=1 Tax=Exiguobacterium sp. s157 TaxID=2751233 RepID=UPI001BEBDC93|nr:hypothetical protein [Exiguobacterium sp. s157]
MQTSEYILRNFRRGELIILHYSDVLKLFPHFEYNVQESIKKYNLLKTENTATSPSYTCAIPSNLEKSFGQLYNDALTEFKFDIPISLNSNEELKCHLCNTKLKRQKVKMTKRKSDKFFFIGVDCAKQYANEEYRKSIDAEYRLLREVELSDILSNIHPQVKLAEQEYTSSVYQMPTLLQNQLRELQIAVSRRTEKLKSRKQPIQREEAAIKVIRNHLTQMLMIYKEFNKHELQQPRYNSYKITKLMYIEMNKKDFFIDRMLDHPIAMGYLPIGHWHQLNEPEFSQDVVNQLMQPQFLKHYEFQYNLNKRLYNLIPKSNQAKKYGEVVITHSAFINLLLKGKKTPLIFSDILVASQFNKLNGIINFLNGLQPIISSKKYKLLFYSKRDHEFYLSNSASSAYYKIKWSPQVERHLKKIWTSPSEIDLDSILPAKMRNQQWLTTMDLLLESERKEENQLIRFSRIEKQN